MSEDLCNECKYKKTDGRTIHCGFIRESWKDGYLEGYLKGLEEGRRMAMLALGERLVKKYGGES